jgi:hypothetical protein
MALIHLTPQGIGLLNSNLLRQGRFRILLSATDELTSVEARKEDGEEDASRGGSPE